MSTKAGHEVFKSPSVFANIIHCLSHTQFHYEEGAPTILYRLVGDDVRKHVGMLDGIALLITIGTEKVVATGLLRYADVTQIVWATNSSRPMMLDATIYIHQLIEKMKDQEEIDDILSYIVPWCKVKIVARAKKLAKIFDLTENRLQEGQSNLLGLREGTSADIATEPQACREGLLKPGVKFSKVGDLFLRRVARINKDSSTEEIVSALVTAWKMVIRVPNLKKHVSAQQWRRLQKLSDYTQACIECCHDAKELGGKKAVIIQKQIFPPQESKVSVNGSTITAVNTFVEEFSQHQPLTDFATQIQKHYPNAREGSYINEEVEFSQHCEITVAQYLLDHGPRMRITPIEVGCSKASCFWCNLYFECLNNRLPALCGVLTSATHGKLCDGWKLPMELKSLQYKGQKITDEVNKDVMDFMGELMDLMFARGNGQRRKSDSVPLDGVNMSDREMRRGARLDAPFPLEETEHSIELLRLLLVHGASPNSEKGVTSPFHKLLCLNPNLEGVKLMLEFNGNCKAKDDVGFTVIHWFSFSGCDVEILRLLLANGGEINAIDKYGETGLHKLLWQDPVPVPLLHEFIKSGADVNLPDKESQQPLYEVCSQGSVEGTRILLDHGADIDHADIYGVTALHAAARAGHLEPVKLLVERQASLIKSDTHLRTAFFSACAENQLETARFLLASAHNQGHHDSIRRAMNDGRTPFSKACGRGHLEIVTMLLAHSDANIDVNAVEGAPKRTALHWAAYNARVEVVLTLLQKGADVTIKDANGKTALNLGGLSWSKDKSLSREPMILALIERDEHTAAQDTDLMAIAAIRNSAKVIEKLLDAKAHPSKQDEHGWTPLQLAKQYGSTDAASILAKRGAVVGAQPSKWVTESDKIYVSEDRGELEYIGEAALKADPHTILANHPIPAGIERFYFEVEIKPDRGRDKYLFNAIGFATTPARPDAMPGWHNPVAPSWGFHGDDGHIYANSNGSFRDYAEPYGKGATIGCGIIYQNGVDGHVFYTRDGEPLGVAFYKSVRGRLYPAVGMSEPAVLATNWGDDTDGRPFLWAPANRGPFDLEAVRAKNVVEELVTKVVPTKIELGPAVTLVNA